MANAAESGTFAGLALLTICVSVLLLLRHYLPLRSAPAFLVVPVFLAVVLPITAILLVPIDLASSARVEDEAAKGIWLPQRLILISWRIIYWLTFVSTWLILPLLGEYMDAGYREPKSRMVYSLRSNGRYQLITMSCAILGLVYMIYSYGFDTTAIKALVMALAYVWGLILAIYLMGHGLVAIPRNMIRNASISGRLRRIQAHAPRVHEKLEDAIIALEDLESQIEQLKKRKTGTARDLQEWIEDLADMVGTTPPRVTLATPELDPSGKVPAVITERYLADLTRRFYRARHQRARYVEEWDRTVQKAYELQLILDSKASKQLVFNRSRPSSSRISQIFTLPPSWRYHLYANIIPAARLSAGSFLSVASAAIIWSEIIRFPKPELSAVSLTVIHHPTRRDYQIGLGGQLTAAFWILYMCACALSSIADVPVWNQRALVRRNTYAESACWYAGQIARLTVPLAYNFLTFLPEHIQKETTFYNFLGRLINLTPLGKWFDFLFPIFILIPVCATFFNLYGRIRNVLGFGILDDDDEENNPSGFGTGGWREGRDLIARDLEGPGPSGSSTLGLLSSSSTSSPRGSSDISRSPQWASPARAPASSTTGRTLGSSGLRNSRQPPPLDAEPDEENFFTLFGRRVKNTFDTFETPRWMSNSNKSDNASGSSASAGFTRPKWMGGDGDSNDDTNFFSRLFNSTENSNVQANGASSSRGRIVL
ncbi:hypothetical protein LTS08_006655 [Lithohypha guttulata]|uniref:uncharacterized protein n=1 Tax=Lithohypha guttulata TaxID=1690604 RepID=UPI002DE1494D|nr:hypothetical protein LTR51_008032 [Lithohypha guttulata]KAK5097900.1 hypothetical protein LTS08_006655 [Lithohypha guttulata]